MDTFTHILIAFLLLYKFDINLAFFAAFMALFVDLDFLLFPIARKYQIFEHRGIAHSFPVVIFYTVIISLIYSTIFTLNLGLVIFAGLCGSLTHILCDSLTNYGTYSLWPFIKKHVKLEVILGVDPLLAGFSILCLISFIYHYIILNIYLLNILYIIAVSVYLIYFIFHSILKIIISIKFKRISLPGFSRIKFKIIDLSVDKINTKKYMALKWFDYNLLTGRKSQTKTFNLLLDKPEPPLNSEEKLIAYSYNINNIKRIFSRVDYPVCEIINTSNNPDYQLFWYSLELESGRFRMGANVFLNENGDYKVKRVYGFKVREK